MADEGILQSHKLLTSPETVGELAEMFAEGTVKAGVGKEKAPATKDGAEKARGSFRGYDQDGKGRYESNFPKGTPKNAKAKRILDYIQNVWSKKPIKLRVGEGDASRIIEAKFDPTFDESENIPSDASKLMGGNMHGSSA